MDTSGLVLLILVLSPIVAWRSPEDRRIPTESRREPRELRRVHYHTKRHMLPDDQRKRTVTVKPNREIRKKPSGHLAPLEEDDMENDEVVSVAIGPPPARPKSQHLHDTTRQKHLPKAAAAPPAPAPNAIALVKDILAQLTKEFLTRNVDENFVFGQYVGIAMRNLTSELRLSMQHEVLELIVKYQKASRREARGEATEPTPQEIRLIKGVKAEHRFISANDTEEPWPDFSNLAKIVG